ncbi:MAG TPA: SRPBCC family protein [Actinomycetes bacterium]|nr:SRPBCC family protein [Actinomycetes bacterium]
MRIEHTVEVDAPLERVWALVNDIPRVAPCMPGAALTGVVDDKTYEGTVAVKLGPLRMSYKGKVVVEEIDEANHSARLAATGKDTKGAGTARASVETRMEPAGDHHTRLMVTSDVQLTGKVASFGRGGAINDVASRLFGQFADCLRATLEAEQVEAQAAAAPSTGTAPGTPAPTGTTAAEPAMGSGAAPATAAPPEPGPAVSQPATPAPRPAASPPRAAEALDAGSLAGTVIKGRLQALFQAIAGFFRRLFGRRSSG